MEHLAIKTQSANACYNMNEPKTCYAKSKKTVTKTPHCMTAFKQDVQNRQIHTYIK